MISKFKLYAELRQFTLQLISDTISSTLSEFLGARLEEWYERHIGKVKKDSKEDEGNK